MRRALAWVLAFMALGAAGCISSEHRRTAAFFNALRPSSPPAEADLQPRQMHRDPAQLLDADLEGDARAKRRLLEEEPDAPTGEETMLAPLPLRLLELRGEVEHGEELLARPVRHTREVSSLQVRGSLDHEGRMLVPHDLTVRH